LCVNLSEISWYMRNEAAIEHIKTNTIQIIWVPLTLKTQITAISTKP
jgi:hypothetical protein